MKHPTGNLTWKMSSLLCHWIANIGYFIPVTGAKISENAFLRTLASMEYPGTKVLSISTNNTNASS
jgi:hypothetical protein